MTRRPPIERLSSNPIIVTPPDSPTTTTSSSRYLDLALDHENGLDTITNMDSGRGVRLLFSKSKVYVHPSASAKQNISGFIALIQQKPAPSPTHRNLNTTNPAVSSDSLLLSWLPEATLGDAYDTYVKVDLSDGGSPPTQSYLVPLPSVEGGSSNIGYAFAVPVKNIYSLLVRPPSIGWWYGSLVINTRAGDSYPALFFHDNECESTILQKKKRAKESFDPFDEQGTLFWGGDEVLRWLRKYVTIERSGSEPNVYLVNPNDDDIQSFVKKPIAVGSPRSDKSRPDSGVQSQFPTSSNGAGAPGDASMDPLTKTLKEARWSLLEKLSQVTRFSRRAAQSIAENPNVPVQVRRLMKNPEVQTIQNEFDSARLYLARWAMGIAEQSDRARDQRIWTAKEVLELEETELGDFEILDGQLDSNRAKSTRKPITMAEWAELFNPTDGRLEVTPDEVKDRVFHNGLDPDDGVRAEAWLFLLGVYTWDSTKDERKATLASLSDEHARLKGVWWERLYVQGGKGPEGDWWKEQRMRIEKDVHRTDRHVPLFAGEDIPHPDPNSPFAEVGTNIHMEQLKDILLTYDVYNKDLGYVQGMSDLLAPIYAVVQDDSVAFWCFVRFMERMERNFLRDQSGMRNQLLAFDQLLQLMDPKLYVHLQSADSTNFFFFFRMLLVWYKREFEWDDILSMWEVLWTDWLSSSFHLFIALAILQKHRDVIMNHLQHFDEVLKYVNELAGTIDLRSTLISAERLFNKFRRTVETVDRKGDFPTPTLRQRKPPGDQTATASTGAGSSSAVVEGPAVPSDANLPAEKVISPALRQLLSREIVRAEHSE